MYQLAEINIARLMAPLDDPRIKDFVDNLAQINALADEAAGFVWRLQTETGDATSIQVLDDPLMIVNMSVWENMEALYQYTYYSQHTDFFRRRREWFAKMDTPYMALWWIPVGHLPTPQEGLARLELMAQHGPSPRAFTFRESFTVEEMLETISKAD